MKTPKRIICIFWCLNRLFWTYLTILLALNMEMLAENVLFHFFFFLMHDNWCLFVNLCIQPGLAMTISFTTGSSMVLSNIDFTDSFSLTHEAFYFILQISKFFIQSLMRFKSTEYFPDSEVIEFFFACLTSCFNLIVLLMELASSIIVIKYISY